MTPKTPKVRISKGGFASRSSYWQPGTPILESGFRSGLEERISDQLKGAKCPFEYEKTKLAYKVPARDAKYTPDFHLNGRIFVESKGRFRTPADRQKLLLVKEQHPDLDLRLVFQRANTPLYKGSKTTYAMWADSHGFQWADKGRIPEEWIEEAKSGRE